MELQSRSDRRPSYQFKGIMRLGVTLLVLCCALSMHAQNEESELLRAPSPWNVADFSLASSGGSNTAALSIYRMYPVAFKKRFSVGFGARFSGFYGMDNGYVTAPAKVSEGNFFKVQNEVKLDTLYMAHTSVGMLNAAIYLEFKITPRIGAQFNIDGIGYSFGADRSGRFEALTESYPITSEKASVTNFNLLLTGDYDIGSLNSELSLLIKLNDQWVVRPGVSFVFTEYTTYNKLAFNNDRFRKKSLMPMVGLSYVFKPKPSSQETILE